MKVTWNSKPPAGVPESIHRFSVIDAIETASNYIHGQASDFAHVEVGSKAKTILTVLPQYVPHTAKDGQIGWIGNRKVTEHPSAGWFRVASGSVYCDIEIV